MKTALVIGSAGFVGRHLVPRLEAEGYYVTQVDPRNRCMYQCTFEEWVQSNGHWKFDCVYHLGAHIPDVNERMHGGVEQFQDIALDFAVAKWVALNPPKQAFVWPTSCAVDYADDPYAFCKIAGEHIFGSLVKHGVKVKMLRPFSGHGSDQADSYPFPAILKRALRREDPLTVWGSGRQRRDWVHCDDLINAFLLAKEDCWPVGEPVEIGTGIGTDFLTLARMMAEEVGYLPEIKPLTEKAESSKSRIANPARAKEIGWAPTISLRESIRRSLRELGGHEHDTDIHD